MQLRHTETPNPSRKSAHIKGKKWSSGTAAAETETCMTDTKMARRSASPERVMYRHPATARHTPVVCDTARALHAPHTHYGRATALLRHHTDTWWPRVAANHHDTRASAQPATPRTCNDPHGLLQTSPRCLGFTRKGQSWFFCFLSDACWTLKPDGR